MGCDVEVARWYLPNVPASVTGVCGVHLLISPPRVTICHSIRVRIYSDNIFLSFQTFKV